ncbi:hypothetical protein ABZ953_16130 [Streptomyces sp. NPDC046465]|uniref:hypothetical protein n=1 Tax=Streptomyces sp. NPDC046465 TaxID=3155810 RepID=UPI0033D0ED00
MTEQPEALSYGQVLADRRLASLLLGDAFSQTANGMIIVAMPLEALRIHGGVPASFAVSMVATAPFVLATVLSLAMGLGRGRPSPRVLLLCDCALRATVSGTLGVLALTDALSLPVLVIPGLALLFDGAAALLLLAVVASVAPRRQACGRTVPDSRRSARRRARRPMVHTGRRELFRDGTCCVSTPERPGCSSWSAASTSSTCRWRSLSPSW